MKKQLSQKFWLMVALLCMTAVSWAQSSSSSTNREDEPVKVSPEMQSYIDHLSGKDKPASARKVARRNAAAQVWSYPESIPETPFGGGSGTEEDPYLITCAQELANLSFMVCYGYSYSGEYFKMTNDIVLNEGVLAEDGSLNAGDYQSWVPIGSSSYSFYGNFDGDGHSVSGVYIDASGSNYQGLFGRIFNCTIQRVGLKDSYIYGNNYVGAICGHAYDTTISNCYNESSILGWKSVGGILGHAEGCIIQNSFNSGSVTGTGSYIAGIVGWVRYGFATISYCYNAGSITGNSSYTAGIVGALEYNNSTINSSFNYGTITSTSGYENGPIVGWNSTGSYGAGSTPYYLAGCCTNPNLSNVGGDAAGTAYSADEFADGTVLALLDPEENYFYQGSDYPMLKGVGSISLYGTWAALTKYITMLDGYDALAAELNGYAAQAEQAIADEVDEDAQKALAVEIDSVMQLARQLEKEYQCLEKIVSQYSEISIALNNVTFHAAHNAAVEFLASKNTLTTSSISDIQSAASEYDAAIEALNLDPGIKVWDFVFSEETKEKIANCCLSYGCWSRYGNDTDGYYYRFSPSYSGYQQLRNWENDGNGNWNEYFIPELEGIYFNQGGYGLYLYTDGTNAIGTYYSGSSYGFMLPQLRAGQEVTINYSGAYCGIYANSDNLLYTAGEQYSSSYNKEVTYTVTSDGDAYFYPYSNSVTINSITLTHAYPNDIWRLSNLRNEVAAYIPTLDNLPGLKSELQAAYEKATVDSIPQVDAACDELDNIFKNVQTAVEDYPVILSDLAIADSVLAINAYVDIAEAVVLGKAINVETSQSAEYIAAFEALESSLAIQHADQIEMTDWAFNTGTVYTVDGLRYYLDQTNNLAEFIGFNKNSSLEELTIPNTVRVDSVTYCVVAVINANHNNQSNIKSVTLPKSMRYLGDYAFAYYNELTYLDIPENVTAMGSNVLYETNNLHSMKVNATVPPTIGSLNGTSYKKITVPAESFHAYRTTSVWNNYILIGGEGVTVSTGKISAGELGRIVLDEASYIQEVNKLIIDEGTMNSDDWKTIKNMTNLIEVDLSGVTMSTMPSSVFDGRWAIEKVVLPRNVQTIDSYALRGTGIKSIDFPETLERINSYAFTSCTSLTDVNFNEGLTYIGERAFQSTNIENLVLPNSVKEIAGWVFENYRDVPTIKTVHLGDSLRIIGDGAFQYQRLLQSVDFPESLEKIGSGAFSYCNLSSITLPEGITSISGNAFAYNAALESITFPNGLTTINSYAFRDCTGLKSVKCNEALNTINSHAFYNCTALESIEFNEGLKNIYGNAFYNCKALTEVVLPSSLVICQDNPFNECDGIKKFEVRAVIPPTTTGDCPLTNVDMSDVTLYVPSWSVSEYQLASGWSSFYTVETTDFMPQNIVVNKDFYFTLRDTLAADYRPNIKLNYSEIESQDSYGHTNYERGNLTISGRSKLAVNDFDITVSPFAKYYADESVRSNYDYDCYRTSYNSTCLLVNGEMRAENVTMHMKNFPSRWQFVTFPFDVKVSDIIPDSEQTSWTIRSHSGANRAEGKTDSVWCNLTPDEILEAGKGYIMHCYNPNASSWWWSSVPVDFTVSPLVSSVNRQLIFASDDRTIALEENLAEFDHNRSWNLIGNPYPCFYDTRFMDFNAPFMVWNSYDQNYVAYNPVDDAYILSPGEAFFVQRPFDQESITFLKDGRQTHRYAREMAVDAPARANGQGEQSVRQLCNIILSQDSLTDRTRVVFNENADMSYEMSRDAAKFASTDKNVPQIFTLNGKTRYAINERPTLTGDVTLGVYCGTDGEYTISLSGKFDGKVIVEDKAKNIFHEISEGNGYVFTAKAGEYLNRFVLHFQNEATGIETVDSDNGNSAEPIYNLQGIKVNTPASNGVFIKNGQKTIVK